MLTDAPLVEVLVHYSLSVIVVRMLPQFLPTGASYYCPVQVPVLTPGTERWLSYTHPHVYTTH